MDRLEDVWEEREEDSWEEERRKEVTCNSEIIRDADGSLICQETGVVIGNDSIADDSERIFRDDPRSLPRVGGPITNLRHDLGMGAEMSVRKSRNPLERMAQRRIRRRTRREEAQKITIFRLANDVTSRITMPRAARETVGIILRRYLEKERPSGERHMRALVAAAVLKVVEKYNLFVTRESVLQMLEVSQEDLWSATRELTEKGAIDILRRETGGGQERILARVETYINGLVSELGLDNVVAKDSMEFLRKAIRSGKSLYGKRPEAIAAATVYLIARLYGYESVSQALVAERLNIKESNVRKIYRYLIDNMVVLVPL